MGTELEDPIDEWKDTCSLNQKEKGTGSKCDNPPHVTFWQKVYNYFHLRKG
jgi:hypothetical protein